MRKAALTISADFKEGFIYTSVILFFLFLPYFMWRVVEHYYNTDSDNQVLFTNPTAVFLSSEARKPYPYTAPVMTKVAGCEYLRLDMYSDGTCWSYINDVGTSVHYTTWNFGGRTAIDIAQGFNKVIIIDDLHRPWVTSPTGTPATNNTCTMYATDSSGSAFNYLYKAYAYFGSYFGTPATADTLYHWADADSYQWVDGSGTRKIKAYPIFIAPSGRTIKKVAAGLTCMILLDNGDVYTRPTGGSSFAKLTLPAVSYCVDLSSSYRNFMVLLLHTYAGGDANCGVISWMGSESGYFGDIASRVTPFILSWTYANHFRHVECNDNSYILTDSAGFAFGGGDNAQGEVGIGSEVVNNYNYANFTGIPTPYAWTTDKLQAPVFPAQAIAAGHKFKYIADQKGFAFYHVMIDEFDSSWIWGRSKSFVSDFRHANNESTLPNCLDKLVPTPWTPKANMTGVYFDFVKPVAHCVVGPTGSTQSVSSSSVSLGGADTAGYIGTPALTLVSYAWTIGTKPGGAPNPTFVTPTSPSSMVTGLQNGTYKLYKKITDNNGGIWADSVTVNVNLSTCTGCWIHHKSFKRKVISL